MVVSIGAAAGGAMQVGTIQKPEQGCCVALWSLKAGSFSPCLM
jgi:hypothetical protein